MIANLTRDILETFLPVSIVDILMPLLGILIVVNVLLGSAVMLTYADAASSPGCRTASAQTVSVRSAHCRASPTYSNSSSRKT